MRFFKEINWFVNFGQIAAIVPYHLKSDRNSDSSNTDKKRFIFSWLNPSTLWFALSFSWHIFAIFISIKFLKLWVQLLAIPKTIFVLFGLTEGAQYSIFFISHGMMLRYRQLRSAVESITSNAIIELEDKTKDLPSYQNTTKKRTVIGIFLILISVTKPIISLYFDRMLTLAIQPLLTVVNSQYLPVSYSFYGFK
jgi:hypothetical protein